MISIKISIDVEIFRTSLRNRPIDGKLVFSCFDAAVLYRLWNIFTILTSDSSTYDIVSYTVPFVVSIIFLVGTAIFVDVSYPESIAALMEDLLATDIKSLTFMQRYFTGNLFVYMMWVFIVATALYFIIPIYGLASGYMSTVDAVSYFLLLFLFELLIGFWLVAVLPENMVKNNFQGSSYFFDSCCCCCCRTSAFFKTHFGSDFLAATWMITIATIVAFGYSVYSLIQYPTDNTVIVTFTASILMLLGTLLMTYASYPTDVAFGTSLGWHILTCQYGTYQPKTSPILSHAEDPVNEHTALMGANRAD